MTIWTSKLPFCLRILLGTYAAFLMTFNPIALVFDPLVLPLP